MPFVKVSSEGQIVLPEEIREALGLSIDTVLKVSCEGQSIILEPVTSSVIERLHGKFAGMPLLEDLETEHHQEMRHDLHP